MALIAEASNAWRILADSASEICRRRIRPNQPIHFCLQPKVDILSFGSSILNQGKDRRQSAPSAVIRAGVKPPSRQRSQDSHRASDSDIPIAHAISRQPSRQRFRHAA